MKLLDVKTGEVTAANGTGILRTTALGSCVAIVAYDANTRTGGLAHIMLPGKAPPKCDSSELTRYAVNAIDEMLGRMTRLGARCSDIRTALVGGANVLQREDDVICSNNITSITNHLTSREIPVHKKAVGGTERRSVSLDVEQGLMHYNEGGNSSIAYSLTDQEEK